MLLYGRRKMPFFKLEVVELLFDELFLLHDAVEVAEDGRGWVIPF